MSTGKEPHKETLIERIIGWCAQNGFLVMVGTLFLIVAGVLAIKNVKLDAIPDLSDVQVIVFTEWPGRDPQLVEDQITYPIVSALAAAPRVKYVRGQTFFGLSFVNVIFEDGTDMYWARSRVLEYLNQVAGDLPPGISPRLGPDATGVGWVYEYALVDHTGQHSLEELRSFQDWVLRYYLQNTPGVAEVASIGGFVKQYQVDVDPNRLLAYDIPLPKLIGAIRDENGMLAGFVFVDTKNIDLGTYVARAKQRIAEQVRLPAGYYLEWGGQYQYLLAARQTLKLVVPLTLLIIFVLLYLNFRNLIETAIVLLSIPFALVGGVWLMWALQYDFSVAVAVGFIALAGVASEIGVVMIVYLDEAWRHLRQSNDQPTRVDLEGAVIEGASQRVRPVMMTFSAVVAGLLPIMWGHGTGAQAMSCMNHSRSRLT
jgi:Cu/Ag efflux pump CusA